MRGDGEDTHGASTARHATRRALLQRPAQPHAGAVQGVAGSVCVAHTTSGSCGHARSHNCTVAHLATKNPSSCPLF